MQEDKHMQEDKYYYFPTMTKNIMFVRGEKYIIKGRIYTLRYFTNNSWSSPIIFIDDFDDFIQIGAWDVGLVTSLKKQRKLKLKRINEI